MTYEEIIKQLKQGEDKEARSYLVDKIADMIYRSDQGKICLADFIEELESITDIGKHFINKCPNTLET